MFLEWIPRDSNAEADRLADGDYTGFSACQRVHADMKSIHWLVLDDLLKAGAKFYRSSQGSVGKRRRPANSGRPLFSARRKTLKEKDPW